MKKNFDARVMVPLSAAELAPQRLQGPCEVVAYGVAGDAHGHADVVDTEARLVGEAEGDALLLGESVDGLIEQAQQVLLLQLAVQGHGVVRDFLALRVQPLHPGSVAAQDVEYMVPDGDEEIGIEGADISESFALSPDAEEDFLHRLLCEMLGAEHAARDFEDPSPMAAEEDGE